MLQAVIPHQNACIYENKTKNLIRKNADIHQLQTFSEVPFQQLNWWRGILHSYL